MSRKVLILLISLVTFASLTASAEIVTCPAAIICKTNDYHSCQPVSDSNTWVPHDGNFVIAGEYKFAYNAYHFGLVSGASCTYTIPGTSFSGTVTLAATENLYPLKPPGSSWANFNGGEGFTCPIGHYDATQCKYTTFLPPALNK